MQSIKDIENMKTFNNKQKRELIKRINDDNVINEIDSDIIEYISTLDIKTINFIFRNSNSLMQNKLWENNAIQNILILGQKNFDNYTWDDNKLRILESLKKIIKSPSIKKELYNNKTFLHLVMNYLPTKRSFFHVYNVYKTFEGIINSEEFNSFNKDRQLTEIASLNWYSNKILLPSNFRTKYDDIGLVLLSGNVSTIDEDIYSQLNDEELFLLEYIKDDIENNIIIKKYIIDCLVTKDLSFEDFLKKVKNKEHILKNKIAKNYNRKDYYRNDFNEKVYYILLNEIDDELIKEKLLNYLFENISSDTSLDKELLYNTLKRNIYNNILTYIDIKKLTITYNGLLEKDFRLLFYLKFNIALRNAYYLEGITMEQLSKINVKHINKLYKFLEDKTQDELAAIYGICIKMYLIFGYERSIDILSGKFGNYNRMFLDNISKTNVQRVSMVEEGNKYLPNLDKRFINFMFHSPKDNHFINMFNHKDSQLYKRWYYLYNNYDEILEKCHDEINIKKVLSILETEKYDIRRDIITPNCYMFKSNDFLENLVLGNKTGNSNDTILRETIDIYTKMQERVESSIPYVKGISDCGYSFKMMKFDDPTIFSLGYKANCCIRVKDIAHNHLLHAALCRNGRILLLYDKLGDLIGFCPLKRNGNVLIINSIELINKNVNIIGDSTKKVLIDSIKEIVNISNDSKEPIDLVCIGRNSYILPESIEYPRGYIIPTIYEKNDEIYKNTDQYHRQLNILYKSKSFKYEDVISKNPEVSYLDPRDEVKYVDFRIEKTSSITEEDAINSINSINYRIDKENYRPIFTYNIYDVYYNKDWYIMRTNMGITGKYIDNDYRAKEEYNSYMEKIMKDDKCKELKKELN